MQDTEDIKETKDGIGPKGTPRYWRDWIKRAKKAAKRHWEDADRGWAEYEGKSPAMQSDVFEPLDDSASRNSAHHIYWSSCQTLEPALYDGIPEFGTEINFAENDSVAITGGVIVERLASYFKKQDEYSDTMRAVLADSLHAYKATAQVVYEYDMDLQDVPVRLIQQGEDLFVTEDGTEYEGEITVGQDGSPIGIIQEEVPINKRIYPKPLSYDAVLHTPEATCQCEIKEEAYYFKLSKSEALEKFPDVTEDEISWKLVKDDTERVSVDEEIDRLASSEGFIEGWECWCSETKSVYWVSDQYQGNGFLKKDSDIYGLKNLFPRIPYFLGCKSKGSMFPVPPFVHMESTIADVHVARRRVSRLIDGIRRRGLIDGSNEELVAAINSAEDQEFITVNNLTRILEKGGVENMVWYLPVKELVDALAELVSILNTLNEEFREGFGVPDILRGSTQQYEGVGTQEKKILAAGARFKEHKRYLGKAARDLIELEIDLALQVYSDQEIAELVGFQFLEQSLQQSFAEALQFLRDDKQRTIRVTIDTDSYGFVDKQGEYERAQVMNQIVSAGMSSIMQMLSVSPSWALLGVKLLLMALETVGGTKSKSLMAEVVQATNELMQKEMEPKPEPPDYEKMKIELQSQKMQIDMATKQQELQQKEMKIQLQAMKQEDESKREWTGTQLEQIKLQLEEAVQTFMMQIEGQRLQLEQQSMALEYQRVEIEKFKADIQAAETMMEEQRLAKEVEVSAFIATKPDIPEFPETPVPSAVNVEINTGDRKEWE